MSVFSAADPAAARIRDAARRGALTHALLITGPGDREGAARYAAAAMQCRAEESRPCGVCAACRKVLGGIHPDVAVVRDPEHKNVAVSVIRDLRADAYILPNEGFRKITLFPDCALLTEQDQNVLLKIVEEGPPYAAFLFCAENAAQVLQTLRSRCVELKLRPAAEEETPPADGGAAAALCLAVASRRAVEIAEPLIRLERTKPKREEVQALLRQMRAVCADALTGRGDRAVSPQCREAAEQLSKNLTKSQIMGTIEILQRYDVECAYNIGIGHLLGALAVELEEIL